MVGVAPSKFLPCGAAYLKRYNQLQTEYPTSVSIARYLDDISRDQFVDITVYFAAQRLVTGNGKWDLYYFVSVILHQRTKLEFEFNTEMLDVLDRLYMSISQLTKFEQIVLCGLLYDNKTIEQLAEECQFTKPHVYQLRDSAVKSLQKKCHTDFISGYSQAKLYETVISFALQSIVDQSFYITCLQDNQYRNETLPIPPFNIPLLALKSFFQKQSLDVYQLLMSGCVVLQDMLLMELRDLWRIYGDISLPDLEIKIRNLLSPFGIQVNLLAEAELSRSLVDCLSAVTHEQGANVTLDWREIPLCQLGLSKRAEKCILASDIKTVWHLTQMTDAQILELPGIGEKTLSEIHSLLIKFTHKYCADVTPEPVEKPLQDSPVCPTYAWNETPISDLGLSQSSLEGLITSKCARIVDVLNLRESTVLIIKNFSPQNYNEIRSKLNEVLMLNGIGWPEPGIDNPWNLRSLQVYSTGITSCTVGSWCCEKIIQTLQNIFYPIKVGIATINVIYDWHTERAIAETTSFPIQRQMAAYFPLSVLREMFEDKEITLWRYLPDFSISMDATLVTGNSRTITEAVTIE